MVWKIDDPQCNESKKIVWEVAPYLKGRGLDIGAGDFRILPHATTVDNMHHAAFGFQTRPDVLCDAAKLDVFGSQSMDFVYSSHTLEHIEDAAGAVREWWRVLRHGGYLVLYLPHKLFYPNIGTRGCNPDHKHDFLPADVIAMLPNGHDVLECQERNENQEYSFLLVVQKLQGKERKASYLDPRPEKTACVVRYGAFGDLMQASSVFAALKSEGYHVTLFSSLPGSDAVANDPNVDKHVLFDKDQVPNGNLVDFWNWQRKKFTKFVNLSESVEGTFLAMPGRTLHFYPPRVRHLLTDKNYVEMQHAIAEVPYRLAVKFYATVEEKAWARQQRQRMGGEQVILWSLAGSSVHKTWAGLDHVLAALMLEYPHCRVVLAGGPECKMLEAGWEQEKRVICKSGEWTIRQTLSFLEECDLVIGPETGVLNAAACMPMPKVVFLSHSTHENLTRDWTNVYPLTSVGTVCPGRGNDTAPACHVLHYGWEHCKRDPATGTAQCQADITVDQAWAAISGALNDYRRRF
jgi:ADP-heptose:LPS heptosyltransferase